MGISTGAVPAGPALAKAPFWRGLDGAWRPFEHTGVEARPAIPLLYDSTEKRTWISRPDWHPADEDERSGFGTN